MPKVSIFAGANASGKTTLAKNVLKPGLKFINADEIKEREKLSYIAAGKKSLRLIDKAILGKKDFSFETTMAGLSLLKKFEGLADNRYAIVIFYLFTYPVELLSERVKERMKKGGHPVSYKDIVRRYYRSIKNFWDMYRFYADEWSVINNNEFRYEDIVVGSKSEYKVINKTKFDKFKEVLQYVKEAE